MKSWALSHVAVATIHPQEFLFQLKPCTVGPSPSPLQTPVFLLPVILLFCGGLLIFFFLWLLDFLRQGLWGTLADLELTTQTRLTSNLQQSSCFCLLCVGIAGMPRISFLFEFGHPGHQSYGSCLLRQACFILHKVLPVHICFSKCQSVLLISKDD